MQIPAILESLNAVATVNPMSGVLSAAGFVGGLHHGVDVSRDIDRPFALLNIRGTGRRGSSAGGWLVDYEVSLQIVEDEGVATSGALLEIFHRYWNRLRPAHFSALDLDFAEFVMMDPNEPGEIGEAEQQDLGKDIILGVTSWTLRLEEKQPSLE